MMPLDADVYIRSRGDLYGLVDDPEVPTSKSPHRKQHFITSTGQASPVQL